MQNKIKVKRVVINNSMRLSEILREEKEESNFTAKVKDYYYHRAEYDPDEPYAETYDYPAIELDIYYKGTRIGNLQTGVFGGLRGDLGKRGVDLDDEWGWKPDEDEIDPEHIDVKAWEQYVALLVTRYFTQWKKGQAHFEVLKRQFGIEDELEERKVTKTLAGKKQSPSRELAMKNKKKSPNQGKKPVELDKMPNAKDLANIQLKGEYNQHSEQKR